MLFEKQIKNSFPHLYIMAVKEKDLKKIVNIKKFKYYLMNHDKFFTYVNDLIRIKEFKNTEDFELLSKLVSFSLVELKVIIPNNKISNITLFEDFLETQKYPNVDSDKQIVIQYNSYKNKILEDSFNRANNELKEKKSPKNELEISLSNRYELNKRILKNKNISYKDFEIIKDDLFIRGTLFSKIDSNFSYQIINTSIMFYYFKKENIQSIQYNKELFDFIRELDRKIKDIYMI